jgi:DNA-binding protein HU-beta
MTKAEIAERIVMETQLSREDVVTTVNEFMESVKLAMINGENVYLRGFGTFHLQKRAKKTARNILAKTSIIVPEHFVPLFKPAPDFKSKVKNPKK